MTDVGTALPDEGAPLPPAPLLPSPIHEPRLGDADAQALMARTYYALRYGLAVLALALPIVLAIVGAGRSRQHGIPAPDSISAYYHTGMRNYFVATLVSLGVFLFLYKGFSKLESVILNIAGAAAVVVAFLPTGRDKGASDAADTFTAPAWHAAAALVAFGAMAVVTWVFGPRTLDHVPSARAREAFRRIYATLAVLMLVLPLAAVVVSRLNSLGLFFTEMAALYVFVAYWLTKTIEFRQSGAETKALSGELQQAAPRPPT